MEDHQDDEAVELMVVGAVAEQVKAPPAKKRRLVKVADKGGAGSTYAVSTKPFAKITVDMAAAEETKAVEATEVLKHKALKTKVPLYYDNKTFIVSTSRGFVK